MNLRYFKLESTGLLALASNGMAIMFTIMGWGHCLAMSMNFKLNLQYSLSQCQIFAMQYDSDLKKWVVPKFFAHTHTLSLSHSLSLTLILWLLERITAHSAARQCLTFQLFGNFNSSFLAIISFLTTFQNYIKE